MLSDKFNFNLSPISCCLFSLFLFLLCFIEIAFYLIIDKRSSEPFGLYLHEPYTDQRPCHGRSINKFVKQNHYRILPFDPITHKIACPVTICAHANDADACSVL